MTLDKLKQCVSKAPYISDWTCGVHEYAIEMLDNLTDKQFDECTSYSMLRKALLNGAPNETRYSLDGYTLTYNSDIAARLCTHSELRRCDYGRKPPNKYETWLDVQTRAIIQALQLIFSFMEV